MTDSFDWKTFFSTIIPLIVLIVSPFLSLYIAKKQIAATTAANQRKEWVVEFRTAVSKLLAAATTAVFAFPVAVTTKNTKDILDRANELTLLQTQLSLLLDIQDKNHAKLNEICLNLVTLITIKSENYDLNLIIRELPAYEQTIVELSKLIITQENSAIKKLSK